MWYNHIGDITDMNRREEAMPRKPSSIPENVRRYRPDICTEIKEISGHYYVYTYHSIKLPSGRWGKKTDKCIGKIIPDQGFIPNKNYVNDDHPEPEDEITVLEYGQYGLIDQIARNVKRDLEGCFPLDRAGQIFAYASVLYANTFVHMDQVQDFYEQSWLSLQYKNYPFKMGRTAISSMLDDLGRRTRRVVDYEKNLLIHSSSEVAIDGHAIRSCSDENDLAETGYKFSDLGEDQVNYLMGYDINLEKPLFSRMFRGSCNDKSTIADLTELLEFNNILFVLDRGFYSEPNLKLLAGSGNSYIIPVPAHLKVFRESMAQLKYTNYFYYAAGKKHTRVQYYERKLSDTERILIFRDVDENEKCRFNYQRCIDQGKKGYTAEKLEANKEFFGVYVFQTNCTKPPKEVFEAYKKRWGIETFYQYIKNRGDFNDLKFQDYYDEQGFAFIMLVAGQIHQEMIKAQRKLHDNTTSIFDLLLKARALKLEKRGQFWQLKNARKKDLDVLEKVGFKPQERFQA